MPETDTSTSERSTDRSDPGKAALGATGLTKRFGGIVAVDDVDLAVPDGELRAIIGPNGAGKTTLFNILTNALEPSSGSVYLHGEEVTEVPQEQRPHQGLARSFQSNQLFNELSVLENVRVVVQTIESGPFAFDVLREGRTLYADRAMDIVESVGLTAKRDVLAKNLSHGDQRRLGIAMALATEPSVLLLDEPTSGLGSSETGSATDLIQSIQTERGLTLLLIEHDMDIVLSISDRITVLDKGRVLATGTPEEIQGDETVQEAYLGGMQEEL
jgi:branched-chain amino acid transport system ATP-binding protein